jgi:hypothetical protein
MEEIKDKTTNKTDVPRTGSSPFIPLIYSLLIVLGIMLGFVIITYHGWQEKPDDAEWR